MSLRAHIDDTIRRNVFVRPARSIIAAPAYASTSEAVAKISRGSAGATVS